MEGCRWWQVLYRVLLPMCWPSVLAFATVSITYHWNEYLWPLMMLNDPDKQVLTVGLVSFAMGAESGGQWGTISAGTIMVCLPLMLAFARVDIDKAVQFLVLTAEMGVGNMGQ